MKNSKIVKIALVLVLCLAMILPFVSIPTEATVNNFAAAGTGFRGKTLSILGDSISTYLGISNNTSYNTTIGNNAVYYNTTTHKLLKSVDETWWMQTMDALGLSLCVNNSWSGSCASDRESPGTGSVAYQSRCTQLHNDNTNTNPDIIAIYLGTNDIKGLTSEARMKNLKGNDYPMGATMNADGTATVTFQYSTVTGKVSNTSYAPQSILEAYALMVYRALNKYSSAEVYCFTIQPTDSQNQFNREMHALFNAGIRAIVKHFNDSGKKIYLVDVYENAGIEQDLTLMNLFLAETHHPNALGMDAITNCFLSSLAANSQYSSVKFTNKVTYDLNDVYVTKGQITSAATGNKFSVSLLPTHPQFDLKVKVTMNGTDITAASYSAGTVLIDNVTGPIHIQAEAIYETDNYRWEVRDGILEPCAPDGTDYHVSQEIVEKELLHEVIYSDGTQFGTQYHLPEPVILRNEEPWVIEWKGTGSWGSNMLFSENSTDSARNNSYLFFNGTTLLGLGFYKAYNNGKWTDSNGVEQIEYPSGFANFAASTSGLTLNNDTAHTFRLVNKISDGSNMVSLYVDNVEIGPLNQYYAGNANKHCTDNWVSGKDFVFSYFGSEKRPLRNCNIEYIQVWEGGGFDNQRLIQLQQEFDGLKNSLKNTLKMVLNDSLKDIPAEDLDAHLEAKLSTDYAGFAAYQEAVTGSQNFAGTQEQYDAYADAIIRARNRITYTGNTGLPGEILSVELMSGSYARIGKQVGLRITTAPDVTNISVGSEEFVSTSAMLQMLSLNINGTAEQKLVKVWIVTFDPAITTAQDVLYTVNTYLAEDTTVADTCDKTVRFQ